MDNKYMKRDKFLLIFLILIFIGLNYNSMNGFLIKTYENKEMVSVERVIDGDTVVINGTSVRLLGINTPEKGERYYSEAKKFLEENVMNKTIYIERKGKDRYYRDLGYLFTFNGENINSKIVNEGYANYYFPSGKDSYYNEFFYSWENCILVGKNLCEKSNHICNSCINIKLNVKLDEIKIYNGCEYKCDITDWEIKDEGRKKLILNKTILSPYEEITINNKDFGKEYILTKSGDSIFLRDEIGKLVLWESY
jgi:micrococcal nuclease